MSKAHSILVLHDNLNHRLVVSKNVSNIEHDVDAGLYVVESIDDLSEVPEWLLLAAYNHTRVSKIRRFRGSQQEVYSKAYEALKTMANSENNSTALDDATTTDEGGAPKKGKVKKEKAPKEPKQTGPRGIDIKPKAAGQQKPAREGSKIAKMIDLLAQPGGIPVTDLKSQLERKGRAISGRINRVHGYGVRSTNEDGVLKYHLVYPDGMTAPLAHVAKPEPKPKKEKAPKAEGATEGDAPKKGRRRGKKEESGSTEGAEVVEA